MKVKRKDWEAVHTRLAEMEKRVVAAETGTMMYISTGRVLVNVIVPEILKHMKVKAMHGYAGLLPDTGDEHGE